MNGVIIKPVVKEQFAAAMRQGRIILFSAPCGFGKTTLARALLAGRKVYCTTAGEAAYQLPDAAGDWEVLLLENLQCLHEEQAQQDLCRLIRENPERRFVLLSRGPAPGWLIAFQFAGLMLVIDAPSLTLDREESARLLAARGVEVTDAELTALYRETRGYPLAIILTARRMADGTPYGPTVSDQVLRELHFYYETAVFRRFDLPLRRFLLELAPFDTFDLELARMVSGDAHAADLLDWLERNTMLLLKNGLQQFCFWEVFRSFLLWELERSCSREKRRSLFDRGGLYYELREDYPHALDCYIQGGDTFKVSEMLVRYAELHPGLGNYSALARYYRALPDAQIAASPALMQGMSMLCALSMDYEASERWYRELEQYAARREHTDSAQQQARSCLAWLDISLPQRDVTSLTKTIPAVYRLLQDRKLTLPAFSVTGSLPSVLNGGKDLSEWCVKDDAHYAALRRPAEAILGRDGVCLADCALAESKFEQGNDAGSRMLSLMARLGEVQRHGTPDMEFAIVGLLVRTQLENGQSEDARRAAQALRTRFEELNITRLSGNLDAMLCRIDLRTGSMEEVDAWYRTKAPRDPLHLNILLRYQYLTQAMVELAEGRSDAALLTLAPMQSYCTACRRHIDGIQFNTLTAIALYRKKDSAWQKQLRAALTAASDLGLIRPVSQFGAALLPLLEAARPTGSETFRKKLLEHTRAQAANYPAFLQPQLSMNDALTGTELQVLRLLCADKSNAEIGAVLGIKLATVKTHVSHILTKLEVSRRSEAKTAARRLWLIE